MLIIIYCFMSVYSCFYCLYAADMYCSFVHFRLTCVRFQLPSPRCVYALSLLVTARPV